MKITIKTPTVPGIAELLAQLPADSVTAYDTDCLWALRSCIKQLRLDPTPDHAPPTLFLPETRHALAVGISDAVAQVIAAALTRGGKRTVLEGQWAAQREEKAQRAAALLVEQNYKRRVKDMSDALDRYVAQSRKAQEPEGLPIDNQRRYDYMQPEIEALWRNLCSLRAQNTASPEFTEAADAMAEYYTQLAATTERWINAKGSAGGRSSGLSRLTVVDKWQDACKRLSRDVLGRIREMKL